MRFFREVDLNNDNFISKAELKIALEKLGMTGVPDNEFNQFFSLFDTNNDGRISWSELT